MESTLSLASPLILSLSHQLSHSDIRAASTDPLTPPAMGWRVMANPLDLQIVLDASKMGGEFMKTPAVQGLGPIESVTSEAVSDAQILESLKETMSPSFSHVS